ncbi:MAG: hypothetical protein EOO40_04985 [Deltaproteobacteria bacterium]|nr:MAG: hypothetical protein EOO40_04985 [Deltaproteobacteria bacterium]
MPRDIFAPPAQVCAFASPTPWPPLAQPVVPVFATPVVDVLEDAQPAPDTSALRVPVLATVDAMMVLASQDVHATTYVWRSGREMFMTTTMRIGADTCPQFDEDAYKPVLDRPAS